MGALLSRRVQLGSNKNHKAEAKGVRHKNNALPWISWGGTDIERKGRWPVRLLREVPPTLSCGESQRHGVDEPADARLLAEGGRQACCSGSLAGSPGHPFRSPALRLVTLQAGVPLSEPRMNVRTICLAIRVVKNTLSDSRFKVTGQRPGRGWCSGRSEGVTEGSPVGGLHPRGGVLPA